MNKSGSHSLQLYLCFYASIVAGLFLFTSLPLHAEPYRRVESKLLFDTSESGLLSQPKWLSMNSRGDLVLWDRGTRQLLRWNQFYQHEQSDSSVDLPELEKQALRYLENHSLRKLHKFNSMQGFWDAEDTFWSYRTTTTDSPTHVEFYQPLGDQSKTLQLPSSLQAVVAHESHWFLQTEAGTVLKWDPESDSNRYDTASLQLDGRLAFIGDENRFLTRSKNEIRVFEEGVAMYSRVFRNLKDIERNERGLFVLEGSRRILRLDDNLSVQFTYQLPSGINVSDFSLYNDHLIIAGSSGIYRSKLDESERSFFSSTQNLKLEKVIGTFPSFLKETPSGQVWARNKSGKIQIYLQNGMQEARQFMFQGKKIRSTSSSRFPIDELPHTPFQYFKTDSTFWDGNNRLYYFFQQDQTVESFNREGQIIEQASLDFSRLPASQDLSFLGADSQQIIFEGKTIVPDQGFSRSLFLFNWEGKLQRIVTPQFSGARNFTEAVGPRPKWVYGGEGYVYVLHRDHIQTFDLQGFPGQVIERAVAPVDLVRTGDTIVLLDMGGERVSIIEAPQRKNSFRFGTPYKHVQVNGIDPIPNSNKMVFSGYLGSPSEKSKQKIFVYNADSLEYETVFEHPRLSLHHPMISPGGDTLFFWGRSGPDDRSRLYSSDLKQFAARPMDVRFHPASSGLFDEEHQLLLVPVEGKKEQFYYVEKSDTISPLKNSEQLTNLTSGGFTGYYGVEQHGDRFLLVSGYLDKASETAPWSWNRSDTLAVLDSPVSQLKFKEGRLEIVSQPDPGFSKIGKLTLSTSKNGTKPLKPEWEFSVRGDWKIVNRETSPSIYSVQGTSSTGFLSLVYQGAAPTGGIQGKVVSSVPSNRSNLKLRVWPGGQRITTNRGGNFSADGLSLGYQRLMVEGHKHHFSFPVRVRIRAGEFQILSNLSIEVESELLLLERGIRYFDEGDYARARITLEAYRNLVEEGMYYRHTGYFLETVYRRQGRVDDLYQLYREAPSMFDMHDRVSLFRSLESKTKKQRVAQGFRASSDPDMRELRSFLAGSLNSGNSRRTDYQIINLSK